MGTSTDFVIPEVIPIGEYLLVQMVEDEQDESLLVMTVSRNKEFFKGKVLAIGDGVNKKEKDKEKDKENTPINVGDIVIFIPGDGVKLSNMENADRLISVKSVLGKLRNKEQEINEG